MDLTIADLIAQSGVAARTIREWIRLGLLPRPQGVGPAALYTRDHLLRVWVICAHRREGIGLEETRKVIATMTPREMARYKPKPPAPEPAPEAAPSPALDPGLDPRRLEAAANDGRQLAQGRALPGRRYAVVPLLPGLILMVDEDSPSIVRRAALEIVERYGTASA
jgi:DNA-binding transcriptional MerR regulator